MQDCHGVRNLKGNDGDRDFFRHFKVRDDSRNIGNNELYLDFAFLDKNM